MSKESSCSLSIARSGIASAIVVNEEVSFKLAWRLCPQAPGQVRKLTVPGGTPLGKRAGGIFEFRDGKVVRWQDFGSKAKALEAVGLAE